MHIKTLLSKKGQIEKLYFKNPVIWNFQKDKYRETESRLVVSWGKGWEGELTVKWHEGSSWDEDILNLDCSDPFTLGVC